MRPFRPLLALSSLLVSSVVGAVPLEHVEVAPGVHVFTTAPDGYVQNGNSVVIVDADGVLVFDTFTRPSTAKALVAEIRKLTKAPVRTIVSSHWHPDHWFGNQAVLEAFPGAEVITSEENRRLLLTTQGTWKPRFEAALKQNPTDPLERGFLEEALTVKPRSPTLTYGDQRSVAPEAGAVSRAEAYLRAHWDRSVSLAELSRASGLSPFHLHRSFSRSVGLPPHAFQLQLRVDRAKALLAHGLDIASVAQRTGFADQSHFTRVFRRSVGVTPGRFPRYGTRCDPGRPLATRF